MASIDASTSGAGGIITTADNTGTLNLQSGGSTIATVSSTGLSLATGKTLSVGGVTGSPYTMKNRIINGAMQIDQRNAGASVTPATTAAYVYGSVDRWAYLISAASKFSMQQNAGSVTPPAGFSSYLGITSLSAYSVGAADYFMLTQPIEGFNTADLNWGTANAQTVTLSFWVRSSLTGTFGGAINNSASSYSYPFSYTVSVANTWELKTITISGPTAGTWIGATNGIGMRVFFSLGMGSNYTASAGSWVAAERYSATGATSVVGTNGATFYFTGVQLEVGSSATSFEWRPYGMELELCQRYYYLHSSNNQVIGMGAYYTTTNVRIPINFPTTMRTSPTLYSASGTDYYQIYRNNTGDPFNTVTQDGAGVNTTTIYNNTQIAAGTVGWAGDVNCNNASSYVAFQAEL